MSYLTKIKGCPDSGQVIPGMAHFAGEGPEGTFCGDCAFYGAGGKGKEQKCELNRKRDSEKRWGDNVYKFTASCKYFKAKP